MLFFSSNPGPNFIPSFNCMNYLIEKHKKNQRNEHNFSKIVISVLKIGTILRFIIIYPLNILLKIFLSTLRENCSCRFKLIISSKNFVYIQYCSQILSSSQILHNREKSTNFLTQSIVRAVVQFVFSCCLVNRKQAQINFNNLSTGLNTFLRQQDF